MKRDELRLLTPRARRVVVWLAAAVMAACTIARDVVTTADVASVSVTPPSTTVSVGSQIPLQALIQDPGGKTITGTDIFWSVQNPSIATISSTGVVTGVALGSTQVAASVNGKSGIATITVEKTPVASVVVTPPHVDAAPGVQTQLAAVAYDAAQNPLPGRGITWSTSSAAIATVDANGMVSALSPGGATITATSEGKNGLATITVSQAAVATVTVTPSPLSMSVGQTTQLTATLKDAVGNALNGRVVSWSSSNTAVATVSSQGLLTAIATGGATITATSEGKSGTAGVTITNVAVGSVTVQPQGPSVVIGSSVQLNAIVRDVNGNVVTDRVVTWESSNPAVATVSTSGVVTGVSAGSVTITATSEGKSGTSSVTVTPIPVGSVTVSPATAGIRVSATTTLAATVKDQNGTVVTNRVVTWTSSNTSVATVANGVVTGVAPGTVTITATSEGRSGTATVTVTPIPVGSVTISPATKAMLVTQTFALTVTVKDTAGSVVTDRPVSWVSSNTSVATVSSGGVVTAVAPGSATITATSETKSGTSAITVTPVPVGIVVVQPGQANVVINTTTQLAAVTEDSIGGVLTGRPVTWGSSNTSVATVSPTGLVTGLAVGSATITATSEGKSGTSVITVIPIPVATVTVSPPNTTINAVQATTFTATTKDASGNILTGRVITWSSSNTDVATINASTGLAIGKSGGTATITATSEGKTGTANLTVNVSSVTVSPANDTVVAGGTVTLTATARDLTNAVIPNQAFTWTSNTPSVATVSSSGVVTGVAVGSAHITAAAGGKSDQATVTVLNAPVGTVVVTPVTDSVTDGGAGKATQFTATVKDVNGTVVTDRVVSWVSAPTSVATVAPATGAATTATGKSVGQASIIATSETKADTSVVRVIQAVTSVTISPPTATLSLATNPTAQLAATAKNGPTTITGRTITWSSSNTAIATVSATGLVTAKAVGTATISAHVVLDNVTSAVSAAITVVP